MLSDRLEVKVLHTSSNNLVSFCTLGSGRFENSLVAYLTSSKILLKRSDAVEPMLVSSHLNSILDFHVSAVSKVVLAIEKGDGENNRFLAIKRMFRPSDKVIVNSKKGFFEKTSSIEDVKGLPLNALIAVQIAGSYACYQDLSEEGAAFIKHPSLPAGLWLAESNTPIGVLLVILENPQFVRMYINLE